jgi:uncharacterized protein YndB with AHSA1/START domain
MDRAFTIDAPPEAVWPWIAQLGKRRAGWYLPYFIERLIPRGRRAIRHVAPDWQELAVGDVVPDYGGAAATFEVAAIAPPHTLVYRSRRGHTELSWAISLADARRASDGQSEGVGDVSAGSGGRTRVHLRLRLGPVRRRWLAHSVGGLFDVLTIVGMAAGLRERVNQTNWSA